METITLIVLISSGLGAICALFILVTFLLFHQIRRHRQRLIACLSFADFFDSIGWLLTAVKGDNETLCIIQACIIQIFGIAGLFYSAFLGVSLFITTFKGDVRAPKSVESVYHIIAWTIPIGSATFLLFTGQFGPAGPQGCWIEGNQNIYRFIFGYFILASVWLWNAIVVVVVIRHIRKELRAFSAQSTTRSNLIVKHTLQKKFMFYLFAFMFCWIWGIVNRTIQFITGSTPAYWLFYCQAAFEPALPIINTIVFSYSEGIRKLYAHRFPKLFGCCWRLRMLESTGKGVESRFSATSQLSVMSEASGGVDGAWARSMDEHLLHDYQTETPT
jgi:hypothetical protein